MKDFTCATSAAHGCHYLHPPPASYCVACLPGPAVAECAACSAGAPVDYHVAMWRAGPGQAPGGAGLDLLPHVTYLPAQCGR